MPLVATFEKATELTLGHEGGWYDGSDPRDPNPTMFGVIQKNYDRYRTLRGLPRRSVRLIERSELLDIYREYWVGTCDALAPIAPLTTLQLFDIAINAGPPIARTLVQRSLDLAKDGDLGDLDDDGKFGPLTIAAFVDFAAGTQGDEVLALWLFAERVRFYDELTNQPRLRPNLKSWISRSVKFYNTYIRV